MRRTRPTTILILSAALAWASLPGCISRRDAEPVARAQLDAMARLADAHQRDLAALRAAASALLEIDRELARGAIERAIAMRHLSPTGDADLESLPADIDSEAPSPLSAEIARGAMSFDQAEAWLREYAAAARIESSGETRRRLLDRLSPLRERNEAAAALLEALDAHTAGAGALAADALRSSESLLTFTRFDPETDRLARTSAIELWRMGVVESLDDPEKQAAAERAMKTLLALIIDQDPQPASR